MSAPGVAGPASSQQPPYYLAAVSETGEFPVLDQRGARADAVRTNGAAPEKKEEDPGEYRWIGPLITFPLAILVLVLAIIKRKGGPGDGPGGGTSGNGTEKPDDHGRPNTGSPWGALRETVAMPFVSVGPLGIFSNWFGRGKSGKDATTSADEAPATPPPPAPKEPNLEAVIEQYKAAYSEQLAKLGVKKKEDQEVLLSYFAKWGIDDWSMLSESRRDHLTMTGGLPKKVIESTEVNLILRIEPDSNRETFSRQQIERLLTRARVFAWVSKNGESYAGKRSFIEIDGRAADIIQVWKDTDHKVKRARFNYHGGPIPESFIEYVNHRAGMGGDLLLVPVALKAEVPNSAPQAPVTAPAIAPAEAMSRPQASTAPQPLEAFSDLRLEAQAGTASPDVPSYIMNLAAFELPIIFDNDPLLNQLLTMGELRSRTDDGYAKTIAQAVLFLWNLALMRARPNSSLRQMNHTDRTPTRRFIEEQAIELIHLFPQSEPISKVAEGLRRRVRNDYMLFYEPDRQMADYVSEIAVSAFESSFFDKKTGRFNLDDIFIQLFVKRFALWKVNEVARIWGDMPDELREAFGRRAPGEGYPALFIEFMLAASGGLDISYALERNERPYKAHYGLDRDDSGTISRQVHEELAARFPGLLHYGHVFERIEHRRSWQRQEAAERNPQPKATAPAVAPRAPARTSPARPATRVAATRSGAPAQQMPPQYWVLSSRTIGKLYAVTQNERYVMTNIRAHLRAEPGADEADLTAMAYIIEFRWLLKGEMDHSPTTEFIKEQAWKLLENKTSLAAYRGAENRVGHHDDEYLKKLVQGYYFSVINKFGSIGTPASAQEIGYLQELAVLAFKKYFSSEDVGYFGLSDIYLDLFAREYAGLKLKELSHVWENMPKGLHQAFGKPTGGQPYPQLFLDFMLAVAKKGDEISIYYITGRQEDVDWTTEERRQAGKVLLSDYPGLGNYPLVLRTLTWHLAEKIAAQPAKTAAPPAPAAVAAPAEPSVSMERAVERAIVRDIADAMGLDEDVLEAEFPPLRPSTQAAPSAPAAPAAQEPYQIQGTRVFENLQSISMQHFSLQYVREVLRGEKDVYENFIHEMAVIIEFRWLMSGGTTPLYNRDFIFQQAASLTKDNSLRSQYRRGGFNYEKLYEQNLDWSSVQNRVGFMSGRGVDPSLAGITKQENDYLDALVVLAFRELFFRKDSGLIEIPLMYMDLFVTEFAPLKLKELAETWERMPKQLQDAFGPMRGRIYPSLFIEFLLTLAEQGGDIGHYFKAGIPENVDYYYSPAIAEDMKRFEGQLLKEHPGLAQYPSVLHALIRRRLATEASSVATQSAPAPVSPAAAPSAPVAPSALPESVRVQVPGFGPALVSSSLPTSARPAAPQVPSAPVAPATPAAQSEAFAAPRLQGTVFLKSVWVSMPEEIVDQFGGSHLPSPLPRWFSDFLSTVPNETDYAKVARLAEKYFYRTQARQTTPSATSPIAASATPAATVSAATTQSPPVGEGHYVIDLEVFDHLNPDSRFIRSVITKLRDEPVADKLDGMSDSDNLISIAQAILFLWNLRLVQSRYNIKLSHLKDYELAPTYEFVAQEAKNLARWSLVTKPAKTMDLAEFSEEMDMALRSYSYVSQIRSYLIRLASDGVKKSLYNSVSKKMDVPPVLTKLFAHDFAKFKIKELVSVWDKMSDDLRAAFGQPRPGDTYPQAFIDFILSIRHGGNLAFYFRRHDEPITLATMDAASAPGGDVNDVGFRTRVQVENELAKSNPGLMYYHELFSELARYLAYERREAEKSPAATTTPPRPLEHATPSAPRSTGSLFVDGVEIKPTQRATDEAQVTGLLAGADAQTTRDAQKLKELVLSGIKKFADKVGGLIADFELVNGIMNDAARSKSHQLFEDGRNFLKLSGHARHYYIHLAIEEYAHEVQAAFDESRPPIWFANFIEQIFRHRHRMTDIKEFEQQAAKFRFQKQDKVIANIFGVQKAVIDQIAGGVVVPDRQRGTISNLAAAAISAWEILEPVQKSWFVSQAIPELIARRGELPPAFIRWFSRHIAPELLKGNAPSGGATPAAQGGQGAGGGAAPAPHNGSEVGRAVSALLPSGEAPISQGGAAPHAWNPISGRAISMPARTMQPFVASFLRFTQPLRMNCQSLH